MKKIIAEAGLETVTPYREFIRWLRDRDSDAVLASWRDYLSGFEERSVLPDFRSSPGPSEVKTLPGGDEPLVKTFPFTIDETRTARLNRIAADNRVTVNTVLQALWAILFAAVQQYRGCRFRRGGIREAPGDTRHREYAGAFYQYRSHPFSHPPF